MEYIKIQEVRRQPINKIIHKQEPFVFTVDNLLTKKECEHMINISKKIMKTSLVSSGGKGILSHGRTSTNAWIQHDHDKITKVIGERIAKIVGLPLENAEAYQVIHYDVNAKYNKPEYLYLNIQNCIYLQWNILKYKKHMNNPSIYQKK